MAPTIPSSVLRARFVALVGGLALLLAGCRNQPSPTHRATPTRPVAADQSDGPGASNGDDETDGESTESDESTSRPGAPPPYRAHPLDALFRKFDRAEASQKQQRVSILHVGDSHTASDTITGRIRVLFQDKFGSAGRGYTYPGEPWSTFRQEQTTYAMSDHWEGHLGIVRDPSPPFGAGGVRVETAAEGAWLERGSCGIDDAEKSGSSASDESDEETCRYGRNFDRYAITYLVRKGGGSFTVSVDGNRPTVVETAGNGPSVGVFERGVEAGPHRIRIETEGDGPVGLFGIRTRLGDNGIEYHSLGINGATAGDFASFHPELTRQEIQALGPDLLLFAFGTNEAFNFYRMRQDHSLEAVTEAMADYQFKFRQLLERYRAAAPQAACLVMLPPDVAPERDDVPCRKKETVGDREVCLPPTIRGWGSVVATQRAEARRAGCAVWSQSKAMGGEGRIRLWAAMTPPLARSDGIHLTMDGYDLLAEAFFSDLMRTYEVWKKGGQLPLETRTISEGSSRGLLRDAFR
ncbi:MAG: SGNH/GDSL hydrolase family protein [Bradymonadaceae bacterium]